MTFFWHGIIIHTEEIEALQSYITLQPETCGHLSIFQCAQHIVGMGEPVTRDSPKLHKGQLVLSYPMPVLLWSFRVPRTQRIGLQGHICQHTPLIATLPETKINHLTSSLSDFPSH